MKQKIHSITNKLALNKITSEEAVKLIEDIIVADNKREDQANTVVGVTIHFKPMKLDEAMEQINDLRDIVDKQLPNTKSWQTFFNEEHL